MKKSTRWVVAAISCACAGVALSLHWPIPDGLLKAEVARKLAAATGHNARIEGHSTFALLPSPQVKLRSIVVGGADEIAHLTAGTAIGKLRLLPLIAGRFEVTAISLQAPALTISVDKASSRSGAVMTLGEKTHDQDTGANSPLTLAVSKGALALKGLSYHGEEERFEAVDLVLDWRGKRAAAAINGQGNWRGVRVEISSLLGKPSEVANGQTTPFTLDVKSLGNELRLDGNLSLVPRWQFAGTVRMNAPHGEKLADQLKVITSPNISRYTLGANIRLLANSIAMSNLTLDLDGNALTGALAILHDKGKADITGTLAAKTLLIDPRSQLLPGLFILPNGAWNPELIPLGNLDKLNVDVRLSTSELRIGQIVLSDAAFAAFVKDGRLEISISSARTYAGNLKARFSLHSDSDVPQFRSLVQFEKMELDRSLRDVLSIQGFSGIASGEFEARTSGYSIREFVQNSYGTLKANIAGGAITGIDFERALLQFQKQPLSLPSELRNGRTNFTRARINAKIDQGIATLADTGSENETLRVEYGGKISLPARTFAIDIDAARVSRPANDQSTHAGATSPSQQLRLDLVGPWHAPSLRVDVEGLISNSKAAAPLLRTLKQPGSPATAPVNAHGP
jgi:AsmA protein